MPRVKKRAADRLDDSINVPLPRDLKRRVLRVAKAMEGSPPPTRVARRFIEEGVERCEQQTASVPEELAATAP